MIDDIAPAIKGLASMLKIVLITVTPPIAASAATTR
jgi:hypothetical protein